MIPSEFFILQSYDTSVLETNSMLSMDSTASMAYQKNEFNAMSKGQSWWVNDTESEND